MSCRPGLAIGPAAEEVRRQLLDQISRGQLHPGERLGAERDLAQGLGVSRSTVRQALAALEEAGVVRRVPGRGGGTFVRRQKVERDLSHVVGVPALLRAQGMTAGSRIVSTGMVAADEETRTALGLVAGDYVLDVVRIRLADGTPISLEHARLPAEMFPGLLDLPLGGSLYELLQEHYGTVPGRGGRAHRGRAGRRGRGVDPGGGTGGRRCCRSPARRRTATAGCSSSPTTCSARTARPSPCARPRAGARGERRSRPGRAAASPAQEVSDRTALVVASAIDADAGFVGDRLQQRGYRPAHGVPRRRRGADDRGGRRRIRISSCCSAPSGRCTRPWSRDSLEAECALVRSARARRTPVLGLCYGAQVLAHAFGGRVSRRTCSRRSVCVEVDTRIRSSCPAGSVDRVPRRRPGATAGRDGRRPQRVRRPGLRAAAARSGCSSIPRCAPMSWTTGRGRFPDLVLDAGLAAGRAGGAGQRS